jgi:hypothetical protein
MTHNEILRYRKTEITRHDESFTKDAIRRPHHRRVGVTKLPGHYHRGLYQEGFERGREEEGEYRVRTAHQPLPHASGCRFL